VAEKRKFRRRRVSVGCRPSVSPTSNFPPTVSQTVGAVDRYIIKLVKEDIPSLDTPRCNDIARNYLETIAAIISVDHRPAA